MTTDNFSFIDGILFTLTDQSAWDICGVTQEQYNILSAQLEIDRAEAKQALISNFKEVMLGVVGTEWHHNSDAWCAGANARRKHVIEALESMLSKSKGTE